MVVAIAGVLLVRWLGREPYYEGRPLSTWVNELQHGNGAQREKAAKAIRELGPDGLPYLAGTLTNPPSPVRRAAKNVASHVPDRMKQQLRRFYSPPDEVTSKLGALHALRTLGTNGVPALGAVSHVYLEQPNVAVASMAAQTLGQMGTSALPTLIAALDDGDYNNRSLACQVLATFHTNAGPAVPRLERIAGDEIGPIASMAFYTLSRIGEAAVPALTNLLLNKNATVRSQALYALANIGARGESTEEAILAATEDANAEVRWRAMEAVFSLNSNGGRVLEVLQKGLGDEDPRVRGAAANGMGHRPRVARENLAGLRKLLADESPEVRAKAAFAVGQTGEWGVGSVRELEELTSDTNATVAAAALQAIEIIQKSKRSRVEAE